MSYGYKCLQTGRRATHANGFVWPEPGTWVEVDGPMESCRNGLHFAANLRQVLTDWLADELWLIEVDDSERIDLPDKSLARRARLVRKLPLDDRSLRLFAVDCAARALSRVPNPDPRSVRAVDVARAYAVGMASDKDLAAARDAARAAAWGAARAAARDAAWVAARDAAWVAVGDAAWVAARGAARGAARDAERGWQARRLALYVAGVM